MRKYHASKNKEKELEKIKKMIGLRFNKETFENILPNIEIEEDSYCGVSKLPDMYLTYVITKKYGNKIIYVIVDRETEKIDDIKIFLSYEEIIESLQELIGKKLDEDEIITTIPSEESIIVGERYQFGEYYYIDVYEEDTPDNNNMVKIKIEPINEYDLEEGFRIIEVY